jgi:hypothetical protein
MSDIERKIKDIEGGVIVVVIFVGILILFLISIIESINGDIQRLENIVDEIERRENIEYIENE